jgi:hypothetical protein
MNYKFLFILFALLFVFLSCNKEEEPCESIIQNDGIIVESIHFQCDEPFYTGNFVVDSNDQLDSLMNLNSGCNQPEIDFTKYTLLGRYAHTSGTGSYYRNVVEDTANLRYNYTITVENCGSCTCLSQNMNWVLVPKLPENWTVKFTVK